MIELITRYRFDGLEFDNLPAVAKYVSNEIGKVIDSTPNRLHPRDALAIYEAIVKGRKRLIKLLAAEYLEEEDEPESSKSIFDL